ncbi:MAG: ATP-binding cassette domain-containing protein [Rhizobiaceae bacterium]|nr:ATP-binding cassette domain-containing protein [Rhizobiaceae bacterium]MCV0406865.1 ATP-binding cassette domain-containing protein [Rhizobiaceae bacterium]
MADSSLLVIDGARRSFGGGRTLTGRRRPALHAVRDVTLEVGKGETLGIVGESGCGKTTLARLIAGLDRPSAGAIRLAGRDVSAEAARDPRMLARRVQYVFQDPLAALNPRKTVRAILEAPLIHLVGMDRRQREDRVSELMAAVGLAPGFLERYPHELSGGQAQRVGIARALAAEPELIVLDEPVSALDVSVQAQVLALLADLKARFGLTYVFISHDLAVVEAISDRVAVMYFGRLAETGPARSVFAAPRHPYTRLLLDSAPSPGRRALAAGDDEAEPPDPYDPPPGCAFHPRCPRATDRCLSAHPPLEPAPDDRRQLAACYHPLGQ